MFTVGDKKKKKCSEDGNRRKVLFRFSTENANYYIFDGVNYYIFDGMNIPDIMLLEIRKKEMKNEKL